VEALVIGAGPAGLTAAYELTQRGVRSTVVEADPTTIGGISRTVNHNGYRFDVGGHRFFSKVPLINELWQDMLGDHFLLCPRQSRIHYNKHFFDYPLKISNTLQGLGLAETARVGLSYAKAKTSLNHPEKTFEQWVSKRFGKRLYEIFFKTYTEKVWGIPCNEISADWATQRIKNFSLMEALRSACGAKGKNKHGQVITTLIDQFHYPRLGPGMMWEAFAHTLRKRGTETILDQRVEKIWHDQGRIATVGARNSDGEMTTFSTDQFISTMPLCNLIEALNPAPPETVLRAASRLKYRDYLTVVLIVKRDKVFPDNWIYIHTPEITMGRIQNYKNWSPYMVPDPSKTSLGLEYFVSQQDDMWSWSNERLIEFGIKESKELGFIEPSEIQGGTVFRMEKAYPVYDHHRKENVAIIRNYLAQFENLQVIGRNGQHRYNNMDHSMLMGMYAAQNITGQQHDVWAVNLEDEYHEETTTRMIPIRLPEFSARPQKNMSRI
jgi:protoporphyrinogen oxidase